MPSPRERERETEKKKKSRVGESGELTRKNKKKENQPSLTLERQHRNYPRRRDLTETLRLRAILP